MISFLKPTDSMADVTFRIATPEDRAFYLPVYASTRAEKMVLAGWIDEKKILFLSK